MNCKWREILFQKLVKSLFFLVAQSRPKKANVFGNVDDESPERERAKKKRDLGGQTKPESASDSRKRVAEDPNVVAAKKPKAPSTEGLFCFDPIRNALSLGGLFSGLVSHFVSAYVLGPQNVCIFLPTIY